MKKMCSHSQLEKRMNQTLADTLEKLAGHFKWMLVKEGKRNCVAIKNEIVSHVT